MQEHCSVFDLRLHSNFSFLLLDIFLPESYRKIGQEFQRPLRSFLGERTQSACGGQKALAQQLAFADSLAFQAGHPICQLVEEVLDSFLRAHRYRPHRGEPVYHLAEIYRKQRRYDLGYAVIKSRDFFTQPPVKDVLFLQDWIDDYGLLFEFSIAAYYVGRFQESLDACDKLLTMQDLPKFWRDQTEVNRQFPLARLNELERSRVAMRGVDEGTSVFDSRLALQPTGS